MQEKIDFLWKTFKATNDWIKFADAKAGFLLTANGIFATVFVADSEKYFKMLDQNWFFSFILFASMFCVILSTYFSVRCLSPSKVEGQKDSLVFFSHIAITYKDPVEYAQIVDSKYSEENEMFNQIAYQVWAISKVAQYKLQRINIAIKFFVATIIIGLISALGYFIQLLS